MIQTQEIWLKNHHVWLTIVLLDNLPGNETFGLCVYYFKQCHNRYVLIFLKVAFLEAKLLIQAFKNLVRDQAFGLVVKTLVETPTYYNIVPVSGSSSISNSSFCSYTSWEAAVDGLFSLIPAIHMGNPLWIVSNSDNNEYYSVLIIRRTPHCR